MSGDVVVDVENALGKLDLLIGRSADVIHSMPDALRVTVPNSAHERYTHVRKSVIEQKRC